MTGRKMGDFAREDIYHALAPFEISSVRRAVGTDASEEIFLLEPSDFARVDHNAVALAIMDVLPHTKVWVILESSAWESEPL